MDSLTKDDDVLATAATWLDEGRDLVLATVVSTWGSAPRPAGSQLLIDGDGNFEGSVSGGCVEGNAPTSKQRGLISRSSFSELREARH